MVPERWRRSAEAAAVYDEDAIHAADGREPVGDGDDGAAHGDAPGRYL